MIDKPVAGEFRSVAEGSRLFEQMGRARHDRETVLAAQLGLCGPVEIEYDRVVAAHDEQRRCSHGGEAGPGEIGPATTGDHCGDVGAGFGRGPQRGGGTGTGTEVADAGEPLRTQPVRGFGEPVGEQVDVEDVAPVEFLVSGEQVEQQRAQAGLGDDLGDKSIAGPCLPLPLPWAKAITPGAPSGTVK